MCIFFVIKLYCALPSSYHQLPGIKGKEQQKQKKKQPHNLELKTSHLLALQRKTISPFCITQVRKGNLWEGLFSSLKMKVKHVPHLSGCLVHTEF